MGNRDEIIEALALWYRPGDVFEVRTLGVTSPRYRLEHIVSGYFDYDHIAGVAEAIAGLQHYQGVYATANPVNPDLLARAVNRMRPLGRNDQTTADINIISRRWFLIDCDAE